MTERDRKRVEFGDWQTPHELAQLALRTAVAFAKFEPNCILEPTCGGGSFLIAAAQSCRHAQLVGFDINPEYVGRAKASLPERADVRAADFFAVDWAREFRRMPDPLLVVGNPPWVTNAGLGAIESDNLPDKINFAKLSGLDALTGKSNFDISEWMLLHLLTLLRERAFALSMLCKLSTARRVMEHIAQKGWSLRGSVHLIDAKKYFGASVDAVLLSVKKVESMQRGELLWSHFDDLEAPHPSRTMGFVEGRFFSDVESFRRTRHMEGPSSRQWRSGIKHDCSRVMEFEVTEGGLRNGLGEVVDIEPDYVFPLLKGSDIANDRPPGKRAVLVPQRQLGADTRQIRDLAPKTWRYLTKHKDLLDARKSSIYRDQPPFSVFGIGDYSFAPFKIGICGLYKRLRFVVVGPHENRPVMLDDTCYFVPCDDAREADALLKALESEAVRDFYEARVLWDSKRPINKALLECLSLDAIVGPNALTKVVQTGRQLPLLG